MTLGLPQFAMYVFRPKLVCIRWPLGFPANVRDPVLSALVTFSVCCLVVNFTAGIRLLALIAAAAP
jgi:hypothetical protein